MTPTLRVLMVAAFALPAAATAAAQAQSAAAASASALSATRAELEASAARLEQTARSPALGDAARVTAATAAARIRHRLGEGDFTLGDRIFVAVEGEKELSDTFTVGPGRVLAMPVIGDVPLAGVLRSELRAYLTHRLGQNLRDPTVRVSAYVRLSVQGAVAHPGFYGVPAEGLLSDAFMAAGGTTQEADLHKLRIERDGRPLWEGKALTEAIAVGQTIDQAGLIPGDQFVVPRRGATTVGEVLRFGGFLLSIPVTVYTLSKIF
ncbi:MAG TPA: polysaccharide biosynthesis/export family protein [Gemmatimonadales bacterium]|nr:polysaccharide biosynthesis/export family protein [Gemmatimonadales bacterium]